VSNPSGLLGNPLLAAVVGAGATVVGAASAAYRTATTLPILGTRLDHTVEILTRRGEQVWLRVSNPSARS
jgi:hypothetical protein